jgi:hypothetical protein
MDARDVGKGCTPITRGDRRLNVMHGCDLRQSLETLLRPGQES